MKSNQCADCISSLKKWFSYYRKLSEKALEQLDEEDFLWKPNAESNSVAIIIQNIAGNMLSRWTEFLSTDGEKPWRNREMEFQDLSTSKKEIYIMLARGWDCFFSALESVNSENLFSMIKIRNQSHTVLDALHRQLAHYAFHIGQIVCIAKAKRGENWKSLSIPKGQSEKFKETMYAKYGEKGEET